jgi:uncharacterized RDD family membrane protein YckC
LDELINRELSIVTPEQVKLQYETAGIGSRAGAHIMDWLLLGVFFIILFTALAQTTTLFAEGITAVARDYVGALALLLFFVIQYGYFVLTEFYMGGKTLGKKWMGIRVIQDNGQALTMLSSLIRNFLRVIDSLPVLYSIGIVVSFLHKKDKRIGDMLAGTIVVMDPTRNRVKLQRQLDKTILQWKENLHEFEITDSQKSNLTREDWLLLATFIERLPKLLGNKLDDISLKLAAHLTAKLKLSESQQYLGSPASFLIVLYKQIKADWEI